MLGAGSAVAQVLRTRSSVAQMLRTRGVVTQMLGSRSSVAKVLRSRSVGMRGSRVSRHTKIGNVKKIWCILDDRIPWGGSRVRKPNARVGTNSWWESWTHRRTWVVAVSRRTDGDDDDDDDDDDGTCCRLLTTRCSWDKSSRRAC